MSISWFAGPGPHSVRRIITMAGSALFLLSIPSFDMERLGFGAILAIHSQQLSKALEELLSQMRNLSRKQLADYSDEWCVLPQRMIENPPSRRTPTDPSGMVLVPGGEFDFKVAASK